MKNIFLVDADDTILDFYGTSTLALRFAFEKCNLTWKDEYETSYKTCNDGLWERLERKELTRQELMEKRFPLYLSQVGVENADELGNAFNEYYLRYLSQSPKYLDGAEDFIQELKKLGKIYIVTNGTAWIQQSRFEKAKLWDCIEDAFISQKIGADKPAKTYTDYVLSHIPDFNISSALLFGDSLSADIKMANDAHITSIWFNPQGKQLNGKATPDYTVKSFTQALEIIRSFRAE